MLIRIKMTAILTLIVRTNLKVIIIMMIIATTTIAIMHWVPKDPQIPDLNPGFTRASSGYPFHVKYAVLLYSCTNETRNQPSVIMNSLGPFKAYEVS